MDGQPAARDGARGGVIMEGRDIGTVVFPDAEVKSSSMRTLVFARGAGLPKPMRRHPARAEKLKQDLRERDRRDSTRATAP